MNDNEFLDHLVKKYGKLSGVLFLISLSGEEHPRFYDLARRFAGRTPNFTITPEYLVETVYRIRTAITARIKRELTK